MIEAMIPAGFGPTGISPIGLDGVPDCNSYNPQLAFKAIFGKTKEQARQMITSDATTQILEHELDSKVNFVDFIIKKTAITDRSGRQITKEVLWSLDSDKSIQRATNMEECGGQVWEMTNKISDRVVNAPGESWHLAISPGEKEEHRVMLFHKHDDNLVREYFITLRSPRKALDGLLENITGQKLTPGCSTSEMIVSRRKDQGEAPITPADIYTHFTNVFNERERKKRRAFLNELEIETHLSEKDLEKRNTRVALLVRERVEEIIHDKPSLEALGLVAQSIPKWVEKVKDVTDRKVLDESAKRDLISRTTRSDLIIKPETDYKADDVVVLAPIAQGLLLAIPTDKESIYHHQDNNKYLPERKKAQEIRKQAFLSEKEEKSIEAVVAPLVISAISYILDHTKPPQQVSVLNQDIPFVNHFANSLTLKDAIQQPLGLLSRCKPNEERYIETSSTEPGQKSEGAIVESIALASLVLMGLLVEGKKTYKRTGQLDEDKKEQPQEFFRELARVIVEEGISLDSPVSIESDAKKGNVELAEAVKEEKEKTSIWQNIISKALRPVPSIGMTDDMQPSPPRQRRGVLTAANSSKLSISINKPIGEGSNFLSEESIISVEKQRDPIRTVQEALRVILAFSAEEIKETRLEQEKKEGVDIDKAEKKMVGLGREIFKIFSKEEEKHLDSSTPGESLPAPRLTWPAQTGIRIPPVCLERIGVSDMVMYSYLGEFYKDSLVRLGVFLASYSEEGTPHEVQSLLSVLIYQEVKKLRKLQISKTGENNSEALSIFNRFEKLSQEYSEIFDRRLERLVSVLSYIFSSVDEAFEKGFDGVYAERSRSIPFCRFAWPRNNLHFFTEWIRQLAEESKCVPNNSKASTEFTLSLLKHFLLSLRLVENGDILDNILFMPYYLISSYTPERLVGFRRVKRTYFDPQDYNYNSQKPNKSFPRHGVIYVYNS